MKLRLKLNRIFQNQHKTLGHLKLFDRKELLLKLRTVELPWINNEPYISCVLAGKYRAVIHYSPTHGWSLWIRGVPGRSEILVHTANFVSQLEGCVAPGLYHKDIDNDGIIDVVSSGDAMEILKIYLDDLDDIEIEIIDPPPFVNWVEKNEYIPDALKGLLRSS